jgi:hypothetical protein
MDHLGYKMNHNDPLMNHTRHKMEQKSACFGQNNP